MRADRTTRRRERLIREVTEGRLSRVGIFGGAVCQVCGRLGTFSGWAGAMGAHRHGPFVAAAHQHTEEEVASAIAADTRFCEVCLRPADVTKLQGVGRHGFVHGECASRLTRGLGRRRYVEAVFADRRALVAFLNNLERMRLDLEHGRPGGWAIGSTRARAGLLLRGLRRRFALPC